MSFHRSRRILRAASVFSAAAPAVALPAIASAQAKPLLTYDLRVHGTGGKEATLTHSGDTLTLDLYASVSGVDSNPNNDSVGIGTGTVISTGALLGNLLGLRPPAPYDSISASIGTQNDLDADGDLDIGPAPKAVFGWYSFRVPPPQPMPQPAGGFFVGQMTFTVGALNSTERQTSVNWTQRPDLGYALIVADGLSYQGPSSKFDVISGAPVIIRGLTVADPGNVQYLSGAIANHLSISNEVRPTPGHGVSFSSGVDVQPGGALDVGSGTIDIYASDATSGNFGGRILANSLSIGSSAGGTFTQASGDTLFLGSVSVTPSSAQPAATLNVTGGTIDASALNIAGGSNSSYTQSGGSARFAALSLGGGSGGANAPAATISSGQFTIAGTASIGAGNSGTFTQIGGATHFNGAVQVGFGTGGNGVLRMQGGTVIAGETHIGGRTLQGRGQFQQSGGTFETVSLLIGSTDPAGPSTLNISDGVLRASLLFLPSNGIAAQTGGSVVGTGNGTMTIGSPSAPTAVAQYVISGGSVTMGYLDIQHTNPSPVAGTGRTGGLVQSGGTVTATFVDIMSSGTYDALGGTFNVMQRLNVYGGLDFGGSSAVLNLGKNVFANFVRGDVLNAQNATFTGGAGSLMSFPAGFDPLTAIGTIQTEGLVHVAGRPLEIPHNKSVGGSGTIEGDVTNNGTVAPGNSPGALEIAGSYTQASDAALDMEIAGTAADQFDMLKVNGAAAIDGLLNVSLLDGFLPSATDSFSIVTANSLSGTFDNVSGNKISLTGGTFDVAYSPTGVTLSNFQAVPEPGSVALIALAMTAAGVRRQRIRRRR
jgi:hypothetical protein